MQMNGPAQGSTGSGGDAPLPIEQLEKWKRAYQIQLDRTTPYTLNRWLSTAGLLALFMLRILLAQAYYIVTYALGIYLLNLFLAFLQPKFDPSIKLDQAETEIEEGAPGLPTGGLQDNGEFKPFIRRLPEFRFWYGATRAIAISLVCTLFPFLDIPVYWPILLIYFCTLFAITMRRQLAHMRKYRYVPWDLGKAVYKGGK